MKTQAITPTLKNFHSYLFIGSKSEERLKAISILAKNLEVNLKTNSPDYTVITPLKNTIGIAEIRELKKRIFQKPSVEKLNAVLIQEADKLTVEAQNSLLKLLEEPPLKAIIIMEANTKASFLPTVLSRVAIHTIKTQIEKENSDSDPINNDLQGALIKILDVPDPKEWINSQIETHYFDLLKNPQDNRSQINFIEKLAQTKKMISANVNPKFSLATLIFDISKT